MKLSQWVQIEGNREKYDKWLHEPLTQFILDSAAQEIRPKQIPLSQATPEIAMLLHGQTVGEWRMLDMLRNIHSEPVMREESQAIYDARKYLRSDYQMTDEQIEKRIQELQNNG